MMGEESIQYLCPQKLINETSMIYKNARQLINLTVFNIH